jgi:hypothetical protein
LIGLLDLASYRLVDDGERLVALHDSHSWTAKSLERSWWAGTSLGPSKDGFDDVPEELRSPSTIDASLPNSDGFDPEDNVLKFRRDKRELNLFHRASTEHG